MGEVPIECQEEGHSFHYHGEDDPGWVCLSCGYEPTRAELEAWWDEEVPVG